MLPAVDVSPLNLHSATKINLDLPFIEALSFSPLKSPVSWKSRSVLIYTQRQLKVTSKSHTLNIGQYLVHSERRTADTSTLNLMA